MDKQYEPRFCPMFLTSKTSTGTAEGEVRIIHHIFKKSQDARQ